MKLLTNRAMVPVHAALAPTRPGADNGNVSEIR